MYIYIYIYIYIYKTFYSFHWPPYAVWVPVWLLHPQALSYGLDYRYKWICSMKQNQQLTVHKKCTICKYVSLNHALRLVSEVLVALPHYTFMPRVHPTSQGAVVRLGEVSGVRERPNHPGKQKEMVAVKYDQLDISVHPTPLHYEW